MVCDARCLGQVPTETAADAGLQLVGAIGAEEATKFSGGRARAHGGNASAGRTGRQRGGQSGLVGRKQTGCHYGSVQSFPQVCQERRKMLDSFRRCELLHVHAKGVLPVCGRTDRYDPALKRYFPPPLNLLLSWTTMFRSGGTLRNYLGYVQTGCLLVNAPTQVGSRIPERY
jgi:hypothetical protein